MSDVAAAMDQPRWNWRYAALALLLGAGVAAGLAAYLAQAPVLRATSPIQQRLFNMRRLCRVAPEYERTLSRVVISLSSHDTDIDSVAPLLATLPDYARVHLLTPARRIQAVEAALAERPGADRIELVPYDSLPTRSAEFLVLYPGEEQLVRLPATGNRAIDQQGTAWAQDLFEAAATPDGEPLLLIPEIYKYYCVQDDSLASPDTGFLLALRRPGLALQTLPLAFKGGNLLFDQLGKRRILFCGEDVITGTQVLWQTLSNLELERTDALRLLRESFHVDEAVVLGPPQCAQPEHLFHLDQAVLLLPGGVAGVERITGSAAGLSPEEREAVAAVRLFLQHVRAQLTEQGYRVLDIRVSPRNVLAFQHYANAIPYRDRRRQARGILVPAFADLSPQEAHLAAENEQALAQQGFDITRVPTTAHRRRGGIHCQINAIE